MGRELTPTDDRPTTASVAAERARQGLAPTVTDPDVLAKVARVLRPRGAGEAS